MGVGKSVIGGRRIQGQVRHRVLEPNRQSIVGVGATVEGEYLPARKSRVVAKPEPTAVARNGRGIEKLSDARIAAWVKRGAEGKLFDGGGLYIAAPDGVPRWYVKFRHAGKESLYSVGRHGPDADEFSLAKARAERAKVRAWLDKGLDPNLEKRASAARITAAQGDTFKTIADQWYAKAKSKWTSPKHIAGRRRLLDNDLLPKLGVIPIRDLKPVQALAALELIEQRGAHEMAAKARIVGSLICRYAIVKGYIEQDPFAHLGEALKRPPVVNRATVGEEEMPALFKALAKVPAELSTRLAFLFLVATAVRPGEVRFAPWSEIDASKALWRIPAERMKMRDPFTQPLSPLALSILERAKELRQSDDPDALIFPGFTRHGALSENAFIALLARCGYYGRQTAHGFRAAFSTWANEYEPPKGSDDEPFDAMAIEACLAHKVGGVAGIYNRGQYLARRRHILTVWGEQLQKWGLRLP